MKRHYSKQHWEEWHAGLRMVSPRSLWQRTLRACALKEVAMPATGISAPMSIVLVHGGFVDGSGWAAVYKILKKDGYNVTVVQNPTLSLAGDVAVTRRAIAAQGGPV